mgnify:CR=1 FL=1
MKPKLQVSDQNIATHTKDDMKYTNIMDLTKYKNSGRSDDLIRNWLRSSNTLDFLVFESN